MLETVVVIADASCFIILAKIEKLDLLQKVYGSITTTPEVAAEYAESLPDWVHTEAVQDVQKQQLFEIYLDKGESSAIALALEKTGSKIILDDFKARKIADKLGVVIRAKKMGIIDLVKPILDKIRLTNFRISPELEKAALKEAEEL